MTKEELKETEFIVATLEYGHLPSRQKIIRFFSFKRSRLKEIYSLSYDFRCYDEIQFSETYYNEFVSENNIDARPVKYIYPIRSDYMDGFAAAAYGKLPQEVSNEKK